MKVGSGRVGSGKHFSFGLKKVSGDGFSLMFYVVD